MKNLFYGELYHIQNGYDDFTGGYLDTNGGHPHNYRSVSTSTSPDRQAGLGTGTWKVLSATGKKEGKPVKKDDLIYLQNQESGDGGYLDTNGHDKDNHLAVSTATSPDRHPGALTGTWKVLTEREEGRIREGDIVRLLNGHADFTGGYLDTRGHYKGNHLAVSTHSAADRHASSTTWRFIKAPIEE